MNCPECFSPVEKGAQFCPKCYAHIGPPRLWRRLLSFFQSAGPRSSIITIKKSISIKTRDKDGQGHEYHSLDEAPPELRAEIEKLGSEVAKEALRDTSSNGNSTARKKISVFRVKDASGKERVYHSLDELPPEIRAVIQKAQGKVEE